MFYQVDRGCAKERVEKERVEKERVQDRKGQKDPGFDHHSQSYNSYTVNIRNQLARITTKL